ncbi:hypothetical protein AQJ66_11980 [Streptomyces bungoensis]|uniref:Uncharacterized protein n=1 Tax=Streptomyces bungoensis TaxID=285568 RepID=A0A101T503_9ACTN|nr:hypothetical protein AQJ66_11980 [Streptomyces bungoensis]
MRFGPGLRCEAALAEQERRTGMASPARTTGAAAGRPAAEAPSGGPSWSARRAGTASSPADRPVPAGRQADGRTGSEDKRTAYAGTHWTGSRPVSLR